MLFNYFHVSRYGGYPGKTRTISKVKTLSRKKYQVRWLTLNTNCKVPFLSNVFYKPTTLYQTTQQHKTHLSPYNETQEKFQPHKIIITI